jgi:lipopolysaccharide export system protein LptA
LETPFIKLGRIIPALILLAVLGAVGFSLYKRSFSIQGPDGRGRKLLPENVSSSNEGFTYLQTEQGKPKFEINAKVHLGLKDNKNLFEEVTVKIFGKDGLFFDTVTSRHCEYDQSKEEITFLGDVVIKLSELITKSTEHKTTPPPEEKLTTIQVEKIKYLKSNGLIETEEKLVFARGRIHGKSRGLSYDSNRQSLRLPAAVVILVEPVKPNEAPIEIESDQLDYEKTTSQLILRSKVTVKRGLNSLQADLVEAFLRPEDSSVSRIEASGHVNATSLDPKVLLHSNSDHATYVFDTTGRWLDRIFLQGTVMIRSLNPDLKRLLTSDRSEIAFKSKTNLMQSVQANGNVALTIRDSMQAMRAHPAVPVPPGSPLEPLHCCGPGDKRLTSSEMVADLRENGKEFSVIKTHGASVLEEFPIEGNDEKRVLSAKLFVLTFDQTTNRPEKFYAERQVKVEMFPSAAPVKVTTSDTLDALFDKETRQISQLIQTGHFKYVELDRIATSAKATYYAGEKRLLMEGEPQIKDSKLKTTADRVEFFQTENLVKAWGSVRSVYENREPKNETGPFRTNSPVFASSDYLEVQTLDGTASYQKRAKLWQGDQVIRADTILLYRKERKLFADKSVKSIFYSENDSGKSDRVRKERKPITVTADHLKYEDLQMQATYTGTVQVWEEMGTMKSKQLDLFFVSEDGKKTIQRMWAQGEVSIHQPGRDSWSESAEYFPSERKVILEGGLPRIADSVRGSTSGARLTLFIDDGSIFVEGDSKRRSFTTQRVTK